MTENGRTVTWRFLVGVLLAASGALIGATWHGHEKAQIEQFASVTARLGTQEQTMTAMVATVAILETRLRFIENSLAGMMERTDSTRAAQRRIELRQLQIMDMIRRLQ
jgi:hypothetical protein